MIGKRDMKVKKRIGKRRKVLFICIVLGLVLGLLAVLSLVSQKHVEDLNNRISAQKQSAAAVYAAKLLNLDGSNLEELPEVETTAFDEFLIWFSKLTPFLFVAAIDLVFIAGYIVFDGLKKRRSTNQTDVRLATRQIQSNTITGILLALLVLFFDLTLLSPVFFTTSNLINVLQQININFIVAVGMTFVIISGGIDLSIGSNLGVSALFMAMMMNYWHIPVLPTVICGILLSTLIGLLNGVIITHFGIPPFIATLGTMYVGRGLAYTITGGRTISDFPNAFKAITSRVWGFPIYSCAIMLVVFIAGWYVLKYTRLGRYTYGIGGNEICAKLSGINVKKYKILVYIVSGICCGIAAVILGSRLNSATVTNAEGYEMDAIAAVVIGGASMSGGEGSIFGTLIGILIIGFISNGLNLLGVGQGPQKIVKGIIIVIAVIIDVVRKRNTQKSDKRY